MSRLPVSHSAPLTRSALALALALTACGPLAPGQVLAGGDHAHPHPHGPEEPEEPEPVAVTVFTDTVQLFMEYPRLVPGQEARFLAHVTVLETGEPVRTGSLRIELVDESGRERELVADAPTRDGLFIPTATFEEPGTFRGRIVVESEQATDTIPLDPLVVHADLEQAFAAAEADAEEDPPDLVPFLLEQQWKIGLIMRPVSRRTLVERLQVYGEVEAPHHAVAVVSAPMAGRLLPSGAERLPHLGDRVNEGEVLARLEPPLSTADHVQLQALGVELRLRELELRSQALEAGRTLAESATRLEFAELALARVEALRERDLGTQADLEAARRDVELARRARESAEELGVAVEEAERALADLRSEEVVPTGARIQELRAPISGEIVEADWVAGEHLEGDALVFRVLDLSRVWIAAHVSEFDLAKLTDQPGAVLRLAAFPERSFDVFGDLGGRVVQIGRVVDPETRTVVLHYEAENPEGLFRTGMLADVFLETDRRVDAVAIPESSIVVANGRPVAFVLVHGEAFQKRELTLGIRDRGWVEVLDGLSEGERVVTEGAYLVRLAAASPTSFGAGHAH